jgi:hypothetical protein
MRPKLPKVKRENPVTTENLESLAWQRGHRGVPGLARAINRERTTVWRAVRWPDQFGPTYNLIVKELCA